jgi:outer membrane protein OmpA-like peptidoglycan-associated protein
LNVEEKHMLSRVSKCVFQLFSVVCVIAIPLLLTAQNSAKPVDNGGGDSPSKWDIFAGYSYLAPHGNVNGVDYRAINYGEIGSVTRYFNKNLGIQGEGDYHNDNNEGKANNSYTTNDDFSGGSGGLIFRLPLTDITPFVHGLLGAERVGSNFQADKWGVVLTLGGGVDYPTSLFKHRLAIRLFQVDYQFTHENFSSEESGSFNSARLSAGLVYHIGSIAPPTPVTLACSAAPASIFPGDPVTVTATAGNLEPKLHTVYSLTGPGVTQNGATANVATATLDPGSYTVNCGVKEGKPGKEGARPWESASATAGFTVKAFEPPTIGCSATPSNLKTGDQATISASGVSPQNRPLTYTYSAASGAVSGTGASATYDSAGAATGAVDITCKVSDDKGQSATASTSVTIAPPPPPPGPTPEQVRLEARLALRSVFFPTAQPRVTNPDGGLVASQEQTLTTLATDFKQYLQIKPDAHLTLSGHADVRGSIEYNKALSERRVARAKQFLIEQGISDASIQTEAFGSQEELTEAQVRELIEKNPDLSDAERGKILRELAVIVLAQNRRVDVTLSTTGQQSVRLYPFNAADSLTLLDKKSPAPKKRAATKK